MEDVTLCAEHFGCYLTFFLFFGYEVCLTFYQLWDVMYVGHFGCYLMLLDGIRAEHFCFNMLIDVPCCLLNKRVVTG